MTYYFARAIHINIVVIHRKEFSSKEKALAWNTRTGICTDFDLVTQEEIDNWKGEICWVPSQGEKR
jgi:hypothetical protein